MLRLHWPFFALLMAFTFSAGVFCGISWESRLPSEPPLPGDVSMPGPGYPEQKPAHLPALAEEERATAQAPSPIPPLQTPKEREIKPASIPPTPSGETPKNAPPPPPPSGGRKAGSKLTSFAAHPLEESLPFKPASSGFTLRKLGTGNGPTLLIIGGIQGDEPGGFSAASLIASHYTILSGSIWVVPDLNFASILERTRGAYGDMNRKFAFITADDPEYDTITRIKGILLDEHVSLVLNLHDGSGFYRPTWEDALRNPKRWGQSVIIDQEEMQAPPFSLHATASLIEEEVNKTLLNPNHRYHIYNTYTAAGNTEMAKTLSYFAVCNGKPAFGIEASKEIAPEDRAYYHLQIIEAFMRQNGIRFERDFSLTPQGVLGALNSHLKVSAYSNKLVLHLDNIRPAIRMLPFKKGAVPDVRASKPLLALVPEKASTDWRVAYGNRTLTRVTPSFVDYDHSLDSLDLNVDGNPHTVRIGEIIPVKHFFMVRHKPGYRVNAIGAQKEKNGTEAEIVLKRSDFLPRFSLDLDATTYRVEVYKGNAFAGMVLVRFAKDRNEPLTATGGSESALGF